MTERIEPMAYHLYLSQRAALKGVHNVFHVLLLYSWLGISVHADMLPIKTDGKAEHKNANRKGHHEQQGEMQYLTSFIEFDSSEDIWLHTA